MIKRGFDVVATVCFFVVFLPAIILISILMICTMGLPVLFQQTRPGMNEKPFVMYKFRTMVESMDAAGKLLPDCERITTLGALLRSSSLDELPGLWSVLKGDMSLVGPRPLLMEYIDLYNERQSHRHDAKPGLTGWAQVNGRNSLSWEEKFDLDIWYIENQSFLLDMKIIFLTVKKVITREGISADGEATMSKFTGSNSCKNS